MCLCTKSSVDPNRDPCKARNSQLLRNNKILVDEGPNNRTSWKKPETPECYTLTVRLMFNGKINDSLRSIISPLSIFPWNLSYSYM